ncbi:hypothetical protein C2E23DRAFT_720490 [Lenzites betulinus]|nr:hypothetical protein C2E23DRAFT_720490 [Lenzites betulinus]
MDGHVAHSLDSTLGAAFIGHILTILLYGITSLQAYIYCRKSCTDSAALRLSVWILDTVHAILISGALYWYCITNFTNLQAVQQPIWYVQTMVVIFNISNSIVRCIFGYRLWELNNRSWILPAIIAFFCVLIPGTFVVLRAVQHTADGRSSTWSLYLGLSSEAAGDLIIAVAQCIMLRSLETGIRRSDRIVRTLIAYSINTGLLTSLCALAALIAYAVDNASFVYFAFYFVLSKLYVNALLARLNARGPLFEDKSRRPVREARQSTVVFRAPGASMGRAAAHDTGRSGDMDTSSGIEVGLPL